MMSHKAYSLVAGLFLSLIALGHLLRIVYSWPLQIADWSAPMWASWLAVFVTGFLGFTGLRLSSK